MMRTTKRSTGVVFHVMVVVFVATLWGCGGHVPPQAGLAKSDETAQQEKRSENVSGRITKSDEEWRASLTDEQYRVTQQCGTEPPFTGKYYNFKGEGTYLCVACGNELFSSATKFDSGTGWPSFYAPVSEKKIEERTDRSHGMVRVEIRCSRCGAHLGHLFEDGPAPMGRRYCINSAALNFLGEADKRDKEQKNEKGGEENSGQ